MSEIAAPRLSLLGKPALYVNGKVQPFGAPRKSIALLAYAILHRERPLSRAAVASLFWPDEDDEAARASLRRHLHRALAALPEAASGTPWIVADKNTLHWNAAARIEIDTVAYDRLIASGDLRSAAALYRGDYLDDFYDEWVLPERERFRERQAAILTALADERRRAADYPAAIAFAHELRRLDPMREDAIRMLMSLRFTSGDRSGALSEFDAFTRRLRDELATDPMPETLALHRAIQHDDPSAVTRSKPVAPAPARPAFPFVGREAALQSLQRAWESAARGEGSTAIVSGEAGVGKSRLIGELRALVETQGGRVVSGATSPLESEPYQPFAEALRGALPLLRFERLDPLKTAALASLVPEVRDVVRGVPEAPVIEPARDRQRLFDAVESVLEQLAEKRPLLIVLEDVHWAGPSTIELLQFVARRSIDRPTLVVASFREEDADGARSVSQFLRRVESRGATHVALGPLAASEIATLVAAVEPAAGPGFATDLFAASDGNALFATELLRERLGGKRDGVVPAGIAESIATRVRALSPRAASLLETAAVIGAGFDSDLLRHISGWPFADVFDGLGELIDRSIVRESTTRRGDFTFSHHLVQVAIYARLDDDARRRLHRRVATTIERSYGARPALGGVIARHYDIAGFPVEAATKYAGAARHAADVFAYADAIALASRALEIGTDPRENFELASLCEASAAHAGDIATRRSSCEAMTAIARALGDEVATGTALCRRIELARELGERDEQRSAIAELTAFAETAASRRWELEAALARARFEMVVGRLRAAEAIFEEAEPGLGVHDEDLRFEFWYLRSFATKSLDQTRALLLLERARALVGTNAVRQIRVLRAAGAIADQAGDYVELARIAADVLERYVELGDIEGQALAHYNLALTMWYFFDPEAQGAHLDTALALFKRVQKPYSISSALLNYGAFVQHLGDFWLAETYYLESIDVARSVGSFAHIAHALSNRSSLESMRGDARAAFTFATEALALAREHEHDDIAWIALRELAVAERDLGLLERSREHFESLLAYQREADPRAHLETLVEAIPAYLAAGSVTEAVACAEELSRRIEPDRNRITFPALGLSAIANAFAAAGHADEAARYAGEARAALEERSALIRSERWRAGYRSLSFHRAILASESLPG